MKNQNKKNRRLFLAILGAVFIFWLIFWTQNKRSVGSPNVLYLTQPVTSFSGKIERVDQDSVWVSQTMTVNLPAGSGKTQPKIPLSKKVTYQVTIGKDTKMYRPPPFISYLFKEAATPSAELTIQDLKKGEVVTARTNQDLRLLTADKFEATDLDLQPVLNTTSGKVDKIEEGKLQIKARPPRPGLIFEVENPDEFFGEQTYTFLVNSDTEVSQFVYVKNTQGVLEPIPKKYALNDLKEGIEVNVFTGVDLTYVREATALRIEPLEPLSPPE